MLLQIETTHRPATDIGYLLHKNPSRVQTFSLAQGSVHVFYPVAEAHRCRVALLLDVDPIGLVRGRPDRRGSRGASGGIDQYVNDRPYVASSFMSAAISRVFSSALNGKSRERPELTELPIPLMARLDVVRCRAGAEFICRVFEPLGYEVKARSTLLDDAVPTWGEGPYFSVELTNTTTLRDLLRHLYVLMPVLDNEKHYWVGADEIEKLVAKGEAWLLDHPEKDVITRRYLKHQRSLTREALSRLAPEDDPDPDQAESDHDVEEEAVERKLSLSDLRLGAVMATLRASDARSVVDLGCGEGKLLRDLLDDAQFTRILGLDVSMRSLQRAARRLRLDRLPEVQRQRIELTQGSLMYRDDRLRGFDAAAVVEVVEHLDPPRLRAFERSVFEFARPGTVVITTPNREYNAMWESLPAGEFRHRDHRFEWDRAEFRNWCDRIAADHGYAVRVLPIGSEDPQAGPPTQMAVFDRHANLSAKESGGPQRER